MPLLLVNSNSKNRSEVISPFIDNPFRVPPTPVNERKLGDADGLVNKIPQNKETLLTPATEATTKVTKTDYALVLTQHIQRTTLTAGRLAHFQQNWIQITNNLWILQTISGYHIPFIRIPVQVRPRITRTRTMKHYVLLQNSISSLTVKGAIQEVTRDLKDHFISTLRSPTKEQNTFGLQFEASKHIRGVSQIQTGKPDPVTHYSEPKRLHDVTGTPGHLLFDSNNQRTQKISTLHIRQCNVRISVPAIRTLISPKDIHQSSQTRDCFTEETGTRSDYLPGRPTFDASGQKRTNSIIQRSIHSVQRPGLYHQEREMLNDATPIHCFPRCPFELGQHDNGSTSHKIAGLTTQSPTIKEKKARTIQELSSTLGRMTQVSKIGLTTAPLRYRALQQQYIKAVHRYESWLVKS